MSHRLLVLPTQYDIIDFRRGNRPENILVRHFETPAEVAAYEDGIYDISDEYDRIDNLVVDGNRVTYQRRTEDPEIETVVNALAHEFPTPAAALAYSRGLADAEGYAAPLLVDDSDDRFEQLLAWAGTNGT